MPLSYNPGIDGSAINSFIQGMTSQLKGEMTTDAGSMVWTGALTQIYGDFDLTLSQSIMTYISSAQIIFPPAITVPMVPMMPLPMMSSLVSDSADSIDSAIKSQTSNLKGPATSSTGTVVWTEFCKQVGKDLLAQMPDAICTACGIAVVVVAPGFAAPPMTMSLAPAPPIYKGLQSSQLKNFMQPWFEGGILALGPQIDSMIKGKCSTLQGDGTSSAGDDVWGSVLDVMMPMIALNLGLAIQLFFSASIGVWGTTPVPGMPLITGAPTPGGVSAPGTIIIA